MPPSIPSPSLHIPVSPLTAEAFAPFGTVIENPLHYQKAGSEAPLPPNAVYANQGSALKILDVTHMTNFYDEALSRQPAKAVMNMFVCSPRELRQNGSTKTISNIPISFDGTFGNAASSPPQQKQDYLFDVKILERHPYTFQTFIPMSLDAKDKTTAYLVIVAPTLLSTSTSTSIPTSKFRPLDNFLTRASASLMRSSAAPGSASIEAGERKDTGQPDLQDIRAFLANGSQAVTYAAGTWHAPMVVLGVKKVEFVVVQFANGVGEEDCQERELRSAEGAHGIVVVVDVEGELGGSSEKARL